ncbi:uncharacterized protein K460DRAFT_215149 [Cucurbitaria berberidis CBS 394.84]|uniref:Uncharacterized protein n=1 Tax=Cucurbitaria berberidis CBS 394.84 TaxID=1168544 RepID=A0A9P4G6U8_9PLEO|nr:uncharacterized protein K460DRAFT_215149 [Cucurbitaria berberidis CBS 394.84]KAF1840011.1 hypothetical protein K460DRAFT_215149 [Cucurbitaria berberidis CBS 394.84]
MRWESILQPSPCECLFEICACLCAFATNLGVHGRKAKGWPLDLAAWNDIACIMMIGKSCVPAGLFLENPDGPSVILLTPGRRCAWYTTFFWSFFFINWEFGEHKKCHSLMGYFWESLLQVEASSLLVSE